MAFEGMFDFIDPILKSIEGAFEKGWFYILIIIGFFSLIATVIIVIVFAFMGQDAPPVEIPQEKKDIISNAINFCNEKGFNSWQWVNESTFKFKCYNKEQINTSLDKYYIS